MEIQASRKRAHATEAQYVYDSALFTKALDYAKKHCDACFILSAKYGLVAPNQVISPYEETLNAQPRTARAKWAEKVWEDLRLNLHRGDQVVLLAGERYREFLVPKIIQHGCEVEVPMEGLGIGRQLQWLTQHDANSKRDHDLDRLYVALRTLEFGVHGKRELAKCTGQQEWPRSGLYFFFEPGEQRSNDREMRVVRVGTHGVSRGSKATLWNRIRTHRGTGHGAGNHRGSIFRLHVGSAIGRRDPKLAVPSWGIGQNAETEVREMETDLEQAVSKHIGEMSILWLSIEDEASPASDRAYLERNLVGLLAGKASFSDPPSKNWLGLHSPDARIRDSGLWNLDFLSYQYSSDFLDVLDEYVQITTGRKSPPSHSIAPADWYANDRQRGSRDQLALFGEQGNG